MGMSSPMEEADTEEASSAMEAAGLGLSREGDGEEKKSKRQKGYFVSVLFRPKPKINILFGTVSKSKFNNKIDVHQQLHFICPLEKRHHFYSPVPNFA